MAETKEIDMTTWKLVTMARGLRRVAVLAKSAGTTWRRTLTFGTSTSPAEATLLGLADALAHLRSLGATSVLVVVTDPTLDGYLNRGWRPGSPSMVVALRGFLEQANGVEVRFVTAAYRR